MRCVLFSGLAVFLSTGAVSFADTATSLTEAAASGDLRAVKSLLTKGTDINGVDASGRTALMYAAWRGHLDVAKTLLDRGADPNAKSTREICDDAGCGAGKTALKYASVKGHTEIVRLLLARKAIVKNKEGVVALRAAAQRDS